MADTIRTPQQAFPPARALTLLYKVTAGRTAVLSSVVCCNHENRPTTFRIALAFFGAPDASKQYLYRDLPLLPNDTFVATFGATLGENDEVRVQSANGQVSFTCFPVEVV